MAEYTMNASGINQEDLVDFLVALKTKMDGVCAKLDLDGGVTDTDYAAVVGALLIIPSYIQQTGPKCIHNDGAVVEYLDLWRSTFATLLAKLDADGGVTDTDYASLWAVTDVIGGRASDGLQANTMPQGPLVYFLQNIITNWNGALAKMDADLTDTDYVALWGLNALLVDATGCEPRPASHGAY